MELRKPPELCTRGEASLLSAGPHAGHPGPCALHVSLGADLTLSASDTDTLGSRPPTHSPADPGLLCLPRCVEAHEPLSGSPFYARPLQGTWHKGGSQGVAGASFPGLSGLHSPELASPL